MTVVSAVTVVGEYKQDSMETVTAVHMENSTTSHCKVHQHCHQRKAHCTAGTQIEIRPRPYKDKNVGKKHIVSYL